MAEQFYIVESIDGKMSATPTSLQKGDVILLNVSMRTISFTRNSQHIYFGFLETLDDRVPLYNCFGLSSKMTYTANFDAFFTLANVVALLLNCKFSPLKTQSEDIHAFQFV